MKKSHETMRMPSEIKVPFDRCDFVIRINGAIAPKMRNGRIMRGEVSVIRGIGRNARQNGSVRRLEILHDDGGGGEDNTDGSDGASIVFPFRIPKLLLGVMVTAFGIEEESC